MNWRLTAVLFALNLAAVGGWLLLEGLEGSWQAKSASDVTGIDPAWLSRVDFIELAAPGSPPLLLTREGRDWRLRAPIAWEANPFAVERLLERLEDLDPRAALNIRDVEAEGRDLAAYGLGEDRLRLRLGAGEEVRELGLGMPAVGGQRIYLLAPGGERIVVVSRALAEAVSLPLEEWREPRAFAAETWEVTSVSAQVNGSRKMRLSRVAGGWQLEAPLVARADTGAVEEALHVLLQASDFTFPASEAGSWGLDPPRGRLSVESSRGREHLVLGKAVEVPPGAEPRLYVRRGERGAVFTLPRGVIEPFLGGPAPLRERRLLSMRPEQVSALEISRGERQVTLQRLESGDWQVLGVAEGESSLPTWPADEAVVSRLLEELSELRAERFVNDEPDAAAIARAGLDQPQRTLTLQVEEETVTLELGDFDGASGQLFARTSRGAAIYAVPTLVLGLAQVRALHYRDRTLFALPLVARVREVRLIDTVEDRERFHWQPGGEGELLTLPSRAVSPRERVRELLREFEVRDYISADFEEAFALREDATLPWRYVLRVEVGLPAGDGMQSRVIEIVFTERTAAGAQFGGSVEHGVTFALTPEMIATLELLMATSGTDG